MLPSTPRHSCRRLSSILQNSELLMHEPTYIKVTHSPLPTVHLETINHYQPTISSPSASFACLARFCDFFSQTSMIDIRPKCAGDDTMMMMRSSSHCWMKSTVSIGVPSYSVEPLSVRMCTCSVAVQRSKATINRKSAHCCQLWMLRDAQIVVVG